MVTVVSHTFRHTTTQGNRRHLSSEPVVTHWAPLCHIGRSAKYTSRQSRAVAHRALCAKLWTDHLLG